MSIIQIIEDALKNVTGQQLVGAGRVLEVRAWKDSPLIEIDLHLPTIDINEWTGLMKITFLISDVCFRDYVPFGWDADTATCSLLINVARDTSGGQWANSLRSGDPVRFIKILVLPETLHPTNLIVGLGDSSHPAFPLALQQLTSPASRLDGAVSFDSPQTAKLFSSYFSTPLTTVKHQRDLINWLLRQNYCTNHTSFYLSGNQCFTGDIQKLLKNLGHRNIHIWPAGLSA
ncbi:hypothetical protein SAMN05421821_101420 [Mucilaginibacter lappiensis]|uniref:FAD-binding FR-type domain-containing protein n=1 Tax=Mucilaginibacter lappiensis TaxID=354630 RepID=A0ABR6PD27_9SPHI|nr:hypothetical protein [Mucilaginibacter lappiensis]MBB6107663.1 hypothetical protein [Mucilaginibacter lappiensis]SIQ01233.1 hypothetical protein SAMN05421821_101420 [Mucilaginibacter lappiensis]